MPRHIKVNYIPLTQLNIPPRHILDSDNFLYSAQPSPSDQHDHAMLSVLKIVESFGTVEDARRYVTRMIVKHLTPLVGTKPNDIKCDHPMHIAMKSGLTNGASKHKSIDIGWHFSLCWDYTDCNPAALERHRKHKAANKRFRPRKSGNDAPTTSCHRLTAPLNRAIPYTDPFLFGFLVIRELLRPGEKLKIPLLSSAFTPAPSIASLPTPPVLHRELLSPMHHFPLPTFPDASPISATGSDVIVEQFGDENSDTFSPLKRAPLAQITGPARHRTSEHALSPVFRPQPRNNIGKDLTSSSTKQDNIMGNFPPIFYPQVRLGQNQVSSSASPTDARHGRVGNAINPTLHSSPQLARVLDFTEPDYPTRIDESTAFPNREFIDMTGDSDDETVTGQNSRWVHFYLKNGEGAIKVKLPVRPSGNLCIADHITRLIENGVYLDYVILLYWHPRGRDPWVRFTWYQLLEVDQLDEDEFLAFKHEGVLTHYDTLVETQPNMDI